jgi:hypothetical protein
MNITSQLMKRGATIGLLVGGTLISTAAWATMSLTKVRPADCPSSCDGPGGCGHGCSCSTLPNGNGTCGTLS